MSAKIMGILNVTPDSFSDGGDYSLPELALNRAKAMINEGAAIIDIGGESSRPGAVPVSIHEELERVLPLVETLKAYLTEQQLDVLISVDTYKPEVMQQVLALGADMINDIRALSEPGAMRICSEYNALVCLMHMQGSPETMQLSPMQTNDITRDVYQFLDARIQACVAAGIDKARILVDPGFGFGKTYEQNWVMLSQLRQFQRLGCPVLVGTSRKSMLGKLVDKPVEGRLYASIASAMEGLRQGADILRVHDVGPTHDMLQVFEQVNRFSSNTGSIASL